MIPIALVMLLEKSTGKNVFSVFGGVPEKVLMREGRLRAQGPFRHPILAGTVGATCIPLFIGILRKHRLTALIGCGAGVLITLASASSGPVMSLIFGICGILLWKYKQHMKKLRMAAMLGYLALMLVMVRPPYYLISKIDISGGSTGWHRSFLIEQTFKHFSEWWLIGTDRTRHWMPNQGFASDPLHTDITNYYISFGVEAGFLSMMLVITMLCLGFRWVGRVHDEQIDENPDNAFMIWCFGACLFAHVTTGVSVSYFDQSMLFFWLSVAVISSVRSIGLIDQDSALPMSGERPVRW
jgi:4-amino-4-deoxy-L-arabinose transferase-like glycosyltransferase